MRAAASRQDVAGVASALGKLDEKVDRIEEKVNEINLKVEALQVKVQIMAWFLGVTISAVVGRLAYLVLAAGGKP